MDPLIDADTLDGLREVDEAAMPSVCRVLRRAQSVSGGRITYGEETAVATVPCRLEPLGAAAEGEALGRLGEEAAGSVALPLGTDCRSGDRLEVTTDWGAQTFEVVGDPWAGSYETHLTAHVQREG